YRCRNLCSSDSDCNVYGVSNRVCARDANGVDYCADPNEVMNGLLTAAPPDGAPTGTMVIEGDATMSSSSGTSSSSGASSGASRGASSGGSSGDASSDGSSGASSGSSSGASSGASSGSSSSSSGGTADAGCVPGCGVGQQCVGTTCVACGTK